jgi:pilus assembly protein TadC
VTPLPSALLAAAAVLSCLPSTQSRRARLARVAGRPHSTSRRDRGAWLAYAAPLAVVVFGVAGLVMTAAVLVAVWIWSRDEPRRRDRARDAALQRAAPLACELLAGCLEAGADLGTAVRSVAAAVGGPLADPLVRYAARLSIGDAPSDAARHLGGGVLERLAAPLSAGDGAGPGLAGALRLLAADERAEAAASAQAAGKRAGVWAVGPLTLCFLPAFVLVGVVPVVVATFGDLVH